MKRFFVVSLFVCALAVLLGAASPLVTPRHVAATVTHGPADPPTAFPALADRQDHAERDVTTTEGAASDPETALGRQISPWSVVPFVALLLAIAIFPLAAGHWWEPNRNKTVVSLAASLPILAYLVAHSPLGLEVLVQVLHEYYAFIVLLAALYTISGGVHVEGDLQATPRVNTAFMAIGAMMASLVGTTGAAMLLIRPLLRTNSERRHTTHVFVFFIFLVANIGGSLLPVGDPPLFLGYLFGVPFFWTLGALWPAWLTAVGLLLAVFYAWDTWACSRERQADLRRDAEFRRPIRVRGGFNLALVGGILLAVVFLKPYDLDGGVRLDVSWMQQPMMLLLALISVAVDHGRQARVHDGQGHHPTPRDLNGFTYGPIIEVAVLFAGIFITMVPAICLLRAFGGESGITDPWQFFWLTGGLSSFLDNAPTYATYFALGQGVTGPLLAADPSLPVIVTWTSPIAADILVAISLGAVFMGANTYIGNAPNFMVKAICEQAGVRMPSFFGYMAYSAAILIPTFVVITALYIW